MGLVVEVVEEADNTPLLLVAAELAGVGAHSRLHGEAVLAQGFRLGVLAEQVPGGLAIV